MGPTGPAQDCAARLEKANKSLSLTWIPLCSISTNEPGWQLAPEVA